MHINIIPFIYLYLDIIPAPFCTISEDVYYVLEPVEPLSLIAYLLLNKQNRLHFYGVIWFSISNLFFTLNSFFYLLLRFLK